MELRNTTPANLGVKAVSHEDTKAEHTHLVVPGDSSLWLDDAQWKNHYLPECDKLLSSGNLVIVEDVLETEEEVIARVEAEYEAALAIVAAHTKVEAPKQDAPVSQPVAKVTGPAS